jgi:hypothetical protein
LAEVVTGGGGIRRLSLPVWLKQRTIGQRTERVALVQGFPIPDCGLYLIGVPWLLCSSFTQ